MLELRSCRQQEGLLGKQSCQQLLEFSCAGNAQVLTAARRQGLLGNHSCKQLPELNCARKAKPSKAG